MFRPTVTMLVAVILVHMDATGASSQGLRKPTWASVETETPYFKRLATVSTPDEAARYPAVLDAQSPAAAAALEHFVKHEPAHASMLHTTLTPTMVDGGYRINIIPSAAKATFDVRMVPDEDDEALAAVRRVIDNPAVTVAYGVVRFQYEVVDGLARR